MLERLAVDASRASVRTSTGTEWYSREIINAMAKLGQRPQLTLYRRGGTNEEVGTSVRTRAVNMPRLWTQIGLSAAMALDRPDALFVPAHVVPAYHPPATVVTVHDLGFRVEPDAHPWHRRLSLEASTRWSIRATRRIIAVSDQTKRDLQEYYGADPSKIDVIHHGVNHLRFQPQDPQKVAAVLQRHGIEPPYTLFLSTVQPRKNVTRLVEAFEMLEQPNLRLVIGGQTGWLGQPIEERITTSPARERIDRIGYVPAEDVPSLYAGAELFVLPSLYEGFGMGIVEAMACGCPVVTSNRSSMPEVAGGAAELVDPFLAADIADGLSRALEPANRNRLIARGKDQAARFSWKVSAEATLRTIYQAFEETHG